MSYLLHRQLRKVVLLKIRPVVMQLNLGDAKDVADHGLVHLLCPGDLRRRSSSRTLLLGRLLSVRLVLDWG